MQLTKQNIVSVQLLYEETFLSNNFKQIEQQFKKMKTQINTLKQNSLMIIQKINEIDPFDNVEFMHGKEQAEKCGAGDQEAKEKIGGDLSKIQIQKGVCVDSSQAAIQAKENLDKICKSQEKNMMCKTDKQEVLQSQVSIRPESRPVRQTTTHFRGNQSMIRQFIKDLQMRIYSLESQKKNHANQLQTLQKQNETFKKMLGYKQSKSKQKKNSQNNIEHKIQRRPSKQIQAEKLTQQQKQQQIVELKDQEKQDEAQTNFIAEFNKQIEEIKEQIKSKFSIIDLKVQKWIDEIGESKLQLKDMKHQSCENLKKILALQQQTNALQSNNLGNNAFPTFPVGQKTSMPRTKTSLKSETAPQSAVNRTKTSAMDVTNLNDTIESYRNYYEDKIVEIFQEMDRIKSQYYQVIQKLNAEGDVSTDMDKLKSIAQKICNVKSPVQQKLRKQISQVKRDLKKFKEQFNDLMFDINTGNGQTKTLVIKPNQNKQDWKDVTQKIYKLRQEVLSYVKQLQAKINANNDLTIVIQELEVGISQCKILNGKKVSICDFEKFAKRIQTRLNNFIRQVCQKQGVSYEQEALLVKQPWFCLSCDSQIKNYTGKVGKSIYGEKMMGKKVNPESHMIRRAESKLPSLN